MVNSQQKFILYFREMRVHGLLLFLLVYLTGFGQRYPKHELGLNFAVVPDYGYAVWDESASFLQVVSPITYKYFVDSNSAIRADLIYSTRERNFSCCNSVEIYDASRFVVSFGFQKIYGKRKLKPTLYTDISYVAENFRQKESSFSFGSKVDYRSSGAAVSGGAGRRYEFTPKWTLAYETDLFLHTRFVTGKEDFGVGTTTWNDALLTNLSFNPISNLSINFRF